MFAYFTTQKHPITQNNKKISRIKHLGGPILGEEKPSRLQLVNQVMLLFPWKNKKGIWWGPKSQKLMDVFVNALTERGEYTSRWTMKSGIKWPIVGTLCGNFDFRDTNDEFLLIIMTQRGPLTWHFVIMKANLVAWSAIRFSHFLFSLIKNRETSRHDLFSRLSFSRSNEFKRHVQRKRRKYF